LRTAAGRKSQQRQSQTNTDFPREMHFRNNEP